jgi:phosphoribosylformylglycinamidine synthase subunit PurL
LDALLFGESQSRVILSIAPENLEKLHLSALHAGLAVNYIGSVGGDKFILGDNRSGVLRPLMDIPLADLTHIYKGAIPALMQS